MRKWQKIKIKPGCCSGFFSSNAPPLVLFCIGTVPKVGHWLFAAKTLDFESSIEVLKELGSLYKMNQL